MSWQVDEETLRRSREAFAAYVEPIAHLLADDSITDIMLNAAPSHGEPGEVWIDQDGIGLCDSGVRLSADVAQRIIRKFGELAGGEHLFNDQHPVMSAKPAMGQFRMEALIPPAAVSPVFTIRKYVKRRVRLEDYVRSGELTETTACAIAEYSRVGKTILLGGETGCGKTTALNALLHEAGSDKSRRLIIIEDTPELDCPEGPSLRLEVRSGSAFDYPAAVKSALRQRPNVIALGEVRDPPAALQALDAWNTGHQGFGTVHAPSCTGMLWRMYSLCRQSESGRHVVQRTISDAIQVCIHMRRVNGRRLIDVQRVVGWSDSLGEFSTEGVTE
jgi:type IV secretion system protein TrbB